MRASHLINRLAGLGPYVFGVYVAHFAALVGIVFLWSKFMPVVPYDQPCVSGPAAA